MIINSLWIGELSDLEIASIKSWLNNGFTYHLYTYDNIENIPEGVEIKDANEIIPVNEFTNYKNFITPFSDLFRYKLLYLKGGCWVDCDLYSLRHFKINNKFHFHIEKTILKGAFKSILPYKVINCFIYSRDSNENIFLEMYELCKKYFLDIQNKKCEMKNIGLYFCKWLGGERLLKKMIIKYDYNKYICSDYKFGFPVPWWCYKYLFSEYNNNYNGIFNIGRGWDININLETLKDDEDIKFITVHNGWIKNRGINKNDLPDSFFKKFISSIITEK